MAADASSASSPYPLSFFFSAGSPLKKDQGSACLAVAQTNGCRKSIGLVDLNQGVGCRATPRHHRLYPEESIQSGRRCQAYATPRGWPPQEARQGGIHPARCPYPRRPPSLARGVFSALSAEPTGTEGGWLGHPPRAASLFWSYCLCLSSAARVFSLPGHGLSRRGIRHANKNNFNHKSRRSPGPPAPAG